jgi:hypothetical protein
MPGGLMNIVSFGQQSVILNGNPTKSFFKTTYAKYTNFGLQKFRVDFEGAKTLRLTEPSTFTFKIPRYADLLMDAYLSVNLPHIWSPILPPQQTTETDQSGTWVPYEFKWIDNIGAKMISKISITCGNQTLQEFSGDYLLAAVQRDYNSDKLALFNKMIGNIPELNDPANSGARVNSYPNAYYTGSIAGPEPSIRGRTLYIPLNAWFNLKTQMAFPLVALQYNELHITVTFRPIDELFRIRDVYDSLNNYPYIAPNFNSFYMQFHRFVQPPPDVAIAIDSYVDVRTSWNVDINLECTYCFLSNEESRYFALNEQKYLFKQVREKIFHNVTGANKIELESLGLVAGWTFYFQRSDVNLRNEWSNYTNWPYGYVPIDIIAAPVAGTFPIYRYNIVTALYDLINVGPGVNVNNTLTGWAISDTYNAQNDKNVLLSLGILLDGSYRENTRPAGVYDLIEKYTRTSGNAPDGLYCYNFCLNTSVRDLQPSGAINMNRFNQIELEFVTITPPLDPLAQVLNICDPQTGVIIGVNKPTWRIFDYNFDLTVFEERINVVTFAGGNCALMYAT